MDDHEVQRIGLLLDLQRPAEAELRARTFLSVKPDSDAVLRLLAVAVHAQGRTAEALKAATLAASTQPDEAMNYIVLADLYLAQDSRVKALRAADQAVQLAPAQWRSHFTRANVLRSGNTAERREAIAAAEQAVTLEPLSPDAHNMVGLCLDGLGHAAEQRQAYLRALRLDSQRVLARNNLAALDMNEGRFASGRRALTSALASSPQVEILHRNHDGLVLRVLARAWRVAAVGAWVQGLLLLIGVEVASRIWIISAILIADLVMINYLLGGPSMALGGLRRVLQRVPRARRGLLMGWILVLAVTAALTTKPADEADSAQFSLTIMGTLVILASATALGARARR